MSFLDTVKTALGTVVGITTPGLQYPAISSLYQNVSQNPTTSSYLSLVSSLSQLGYNPLGPGVINNVLTQPKLTESEFDQWFWSSYTPDPNDLTPMAAEGKYLIDPFSSTSTAYNEAYADLVFLPGISGQTRYAIKKD